MCKSCGFIHGKVYFTIGLTIKYFFKNFLVDQKFDIVLQTVMSPHIPPRLQNNKLHLTSQNMIFSTTFYIFYICFPPTLLKAILN